MSKFFRLKELFVLENICEVTRKMGEMLGPCKRCGKIMLRPHPSGICPECRRTHSRSIIPDNPDIPDPLKYKP